MKKKRKKRMRFGKWDVTDDLIRLECFCGASREIAREEGRDSDEVLNERAFGWYTSSIGICMCPRRTIEQSTGRIDALDVTESIAGIEYGTRIARPEEIVRNTGSSGFVRQKEDDDMPTPATPTQA